MLGISADDPRLDELVPKLSWGPLSIRPVHLTEDQHRALYCGRSAGWGTVRNGRGRCRPHHGGYRLGAANPMFKTGATSTLQRAVERRVDDPKLLDLSEPIAANELRMEELYQKLDTPESPSAWEELNRIQYNLGVAIENDDPEVLVKIQQELDAVVSRARRDAEVWVDIRSHFEIHRRLTDSQVKNKAIAQEMMHRNEVDAIGTNFGIRYTDFIEAVDLSLPEIEVRRNLIGGFLTLSRDVLMLESGDASEE